MDPYNNLEHKIVRAIKEAVNEEFHALFQKIGIDTYKQDDLNSFRETLSHAAAMRKIHNRIQLAVVLTIIASAISGGIGMFLLGFKQVMGKG